jgi:alpha-D-xyloside xylohydrolase
MRINQLQKMLVFTVVFLNVGFSYAFEKQADGILLWLKKERKTEASLIKIQVCAENIIRIIALHGNSFSTRQSLMVDKTDWEPVPWSIKEEGSHIVLSTAKVTVRVQRDKGTVAFYNADGRLILQEKMDGSKIITPAEVMGEKTYHIQQLFNSPEDEAFYGLGQHQNDIMNYKGHDVDLWQHNIVAVVPFLVSSRDYGILWEQQFSHEIRGYTGISAVGRANPV